MLTICCFHHLKISDIQFDISKFKVINDLYGEKFGDEVLDFIQEQLKDICKGERFFINLRSDVFMVVTEYEEEQELVKFIPASNEENRHACMDI